MSASTDACGAGRPDSSTMEALRNRVSVRSFRDENVTDDEVDAILVGQRVILRYDPAAPPGRALDVVCDAKPAGKATRLDAYANTTVRRGNHSKLIEAGEPAPEPRPSPLNLRDLKEDD